MHIYIFKYVHFSLHTHTYVHMTMLFVGECPISLFVRSLVNVSTTTHLFHLYTCTYVCKYVLINVHMYLSIFVHMCEFVDSSLVLLLMLLLQPGGMKNVLQVFELCVWPKLYCCYCCYCCWRLCVDSLLENVRVHRLVNFEWKMCKALQRNMKYVCKYQHRKRLDSCLD